MFKKAYLVLFPVLLISLMLLLAPACTQAPATPSGQQQTAAPSTPTVTINPAVAPLDAKAKMVIMGSGFEPGKTVRLVVTVPGQPLSSIDTMCDPAEIVPDETGAWIAVWTLNRYVIMLASVTDNKGEGVYTLDATDTDLNILASTPFALADTVKKPVADWVGWAQVLIPAPPASPGTK